MMFDPQRYDARSCIHEHTAIATADMPDITLNEFVHVGFTDPGDAVGMRLYVKPGLAHQ